MRRRNNPTIESEEVPFMLDIGEHQSGHKNCLTVRKLNESNPEKVGFLRKKNRSFLAAIFPCIFHKWKLRYFVLIGNYLFRYSSPNADYPKGVPIPLDAVRIQIIDSCCIELSMIRKSYIFKASDENEANDWLKALTKRKLSAVKESMGHAPIAAAVVEINASASRIFQKKIQDESTTQSTTSNPMHSLY